MTLLRSIMAVPSTPTGVSSTLLDPNFSNQATHGGSSPAPSIPNSPVAYVRQNAQYFPAEDQDSQQTLPYVAGAGSAPTGVDAGGDGDETKSDHTSNESDISDNESQISVVLLDGDSDSDVDLPMDERLKVRKGWLYQEWKDFESHNASFGVGCPSLDSYLDDGLQEHGWRLINGSWIKTGPPTMHNKIQRMKEEARRKDMKRSAGSFKIKKVTKSSSSKTPEKSVMSMKSMKSSPSKSPMKSMKAMKTFAGSKFGKAGKKSPQTPVKSKNPKACDLVTPPQKAVLSTPPKAPGKGKRALKGSPLAASPSKKSAKSKMFKPKTKSG